MANVIEQSLWEVGVYQIETSDAILGGVNGIANRQALQLANRTLWLKDQVLGLGSGKQAADATLTALAGLTTSADKLIYATGVDTFALTPLTAFIRTLLDDEDAAAARATLGAAPLASPSLTGTPTVPTAADGTNTTQIASTAFVQSAVGGYLSKSVIGGTVTLSDLEASNPVIGFSGALTSNLVVVVPTTVKRLWAIYNATSGAFTLTVKTASGSGVTVAQGRRNLVYTDGSNVYDGFNDFESIAMTGTPTAPTAVVGTSTTTVATTAFVNAEIAADRPFEATAANIKMDGAQSVGSLNTVARGDHVHPTDISRAPLASPALTGTPTAPTAAAGTNNTQIATTAFVQTGLSGKFDKTGGVVAGALKAQYANDWVGFIADNPTEGKSTYFEGQVAGIPRGGVQVMPAAAGAGEYFTSIRVTPAGATNIDRRVGGLDVYANGLFANAYGWLHDYFMRRSDCVTNWYPSHYAGAQTFKIRNLNLMITTMRVDALGADTTLNLPEAYTGVAHVIGSDAWSGKNVVASCMVSGTQIRVFAGPSTNCTFMIIGFKNNI